jgi:hypothetical protein
MGQRWRWRPGCGPSHRDEKRGEQRAPAGQQVAVGTGLLSVPRLLQVVAAGTGLLRCGGRRRGQQVAAASSWPWFDLGNGTRQSASMGNFGGELWGPHVSDGNPLTVTVGRCIFDVCYRGEG